jgi:hypothetical protein
MLECPASDQSGTGMKKINDAGPVRYRLKLMKSDIILVQYRTEIMNARMPMPALVCSMLMPSYVDMVRTGRNYPPADESQKVLSLRIQNLKVTVL